MIEKWKESQYARFYWSTIWVVFLLTQYVVCRSIFIDSVQHIVALESNSDEAYIHLQGLRYDLSAILSVNALWLFLYLLPFDFPNFIRKIWMFTLGIINVLCLIFNISDSIFYPYVQKRLQTSDLLFLNGAKGDEVFTVVPIAIKENFTIFFVGLAMILLTIILLRTAFKHNPFTPKNKQNWVAYGIVLLISYGCMIVGSRGGTQLRPINILSAHESVELSKVPLILNAPFSIMKTLGKSILKDLEYQPLVDETICNNSLSSDTIKLAGYNVVVIIVESLSKQYLSYYKGTSKTPFIDSLIGQGLIYDNGFASARESVQGIPAIVASIPSLHDDAFIFSPYSRNKFASLANILKNHGGYSSSFFHPAKRGSMGFNGFAFAAGFDKYHSLENFPDSKKFDGSWGIWDHAFLQYFLTSINNQKQPFVTTYFTLNPHHPYKIPTEFDIRFPIQGTNKIGRSLSYIDYSLKLFFDRAKKQPWFSKTLFVITADHTGPNQSLKSQKIDEFRVPILFFTGDGKLKGVNHQLTTQLDILPMILEYMDVKDQQFLFGKKSTSTCYRFNLSYRNSIYHYMDSTYYAMYNGEKIFGLYSYQNDPNLKNNSVFDPSMSKVKGTILDMISTRLKIYNQAMIHDQLIPNLPTK